jgi:hypothetical protein
MTTLTWPAVSVDPTRLEWWLQSITQEHISPLTGAVQTQELPGAHWQARVEYFNVSEDDCRLLWAFIGKMRGRAGRVYVPNFGRPTPHGVGGGSPYVGGVSQTGATLHIAGATPSTAGWLVAGDMFGVDGLMYLVTGTVDVDVTGSADIPLAPPLRVSPADLGAITLTSPTVTMMFAGDRQGWTYEPGLAGRHTFAFDLREVF